MRCNACGRNYGEDEKISDAGIKSAVIRTDFSSVVSRFVHFEL